VSAGVTGVLLGPCCFSGPGMGPWGRSPLSLMAPDTQYAVGGPLAAATELKTVCVCVFVCECVVCAHVCVWARVSVCL